MWAPGGRWAAMASLPRQLLEPLPACPAGDTCACPSRCPPAGYTAAPGGGRGHQRCHEEQQHAWHSVPGSVTAFAGHKMPGAMLCSPYIVVPVLTPRASVRTSRFARPSWGKQGGGEGGGIGAFGSSLVPPKTQTLCCVPHPSSASRRRFRYRRQVHRILDAGARGAKHVAERKPAGAVSEPAFLRQKTPLTGFDLLWPPAHLSPPLRIPPLVDINVVSGESLSAGL